MNGFKTSIVTLIASMTLIVNAQKEYYKSPILNKKIGISWRMEKLISKAGEAEQYKTIAPEKENIIVNMKQNKLPMDAIEFAFTARNNSKKSLLLRPLITVDVPDGNLSWWNGYSNMCKITFDSNDINLSNWFPANAAYNKAKAVVVGINPMYLYSRVDSGKMSTHEGDKLFIGLPFVLEAGKTFKYSFVVSSCRSRYGYRDIVQHWYDIFPEAFNPADKIDPNVISGESSYMFWKPSTINEKFIGDFIRRMFNGRGSWEWCYKPFVRAGDWAISDKWSVGWHGWTKEKVDNWRKFIKTRLKSAEFLGVAPMWYVNTTWTEWDIWKNHFPKIIPDKNPRKLRSWGQDALYGIYAWGNDYGKLFCEGINRIPKEYPASRGIGWDSCFGHKQFSEDVIGVKNTQAKSFRKGEIFALGGVGIANLLDLNHKNYLEKYRMANAVNIKLVSPYMIGVRSDVGLYEGNPIRCSNRHLRIESMRARLGTRKALVWHKGAIPSHIRWVDWDDMEPAEARDAYRQLMENVLFFSYYWGAVSAPLLPTIGVEFLFKSTPELVDLIRQGWQPSPGVDSHKDLLIARYGKGVGSRVVVINPSFKTIQTKLFFRADYWNGCALMLGREDGEILNTSITHQGTRTDFSIAPRQIVILRVCGTGMLAESGISDLSVRTERMFNIGKAPLWRFDLKTNDKINWNLHFHRNEQGANVKVREDSKSRKFQGDSIVSIKIVSANWPDDIQAAVKRSGFIELYEYPLYSVEELTANMLKDLDLLVKLKQGKLVVVFPTNATQKVKDEAARICEWFRFYTNATDKRYYEPQITDAVLTKGVSIKLNIGETGLKKWEKGKVCLASENIISISARNEVELRKTVIKFLGCLDKIYPYYGKLPMEKSLIKIGLGGKTLRHQKHAKIFHPTLLEMLHKTGVKK